MPSEVTAVHNVKKDADEVFDVSPRTSSTSAVNDAYETNAYEEHPEDLATRDPIVQQVSVTLALAGQDSEPPKKAWMSHPQEPQFPLSDTHTEAVPALSQASSSLQKSSSHIDGAEGDLPASLKFSSTAGSETGALPSTSTGPEPSSLASEVYPRSGTPSILQEESSPRVTAASPQQPKAEARYVSASDTATVHPDFSESRDIHDSEPVKPEERSHSPIASSTASENVSDTASDPSGSTKLSLTLLKANVHTEPMDSSRTVPSSYPAPPTQSVRADGPLHPGASTARTIHSRNPDTRVSPEVQNSRTSATKDPGNLNTDQKGEGKQAEPESRGNLTTDTVEQKEGLRCCGIPCVIA